MIKTLTKSAVLPILTIALTFKAYAANCTLNGEVVPCYYLWDTMGPLIIFMLAMALVMSAFWLWMLIDCIKRDFKDKAIWILILLLIQFLGALIYFFVVKRKSASQQSAPSTVEQPQP